jgi:hypothetical protein
MRTPTAEIVAFPGRLVKVGHKHKEPVFAIQRRLNEMGCGPINEDGEFGQQTLTATMLFQARFADVDTLPLRIDGEVGPLTWAALFGAPSVPTEDRAASPLLTAAISIAASQIGTMEDPRGTNRGPQVDMYVRAVGLDPAGHFPWCAAFVYFCFDQAAITLGRQNPLIKTAGVIDHWNRAGIKPVPRISMSKAYYHPTLVKPGQIFVMATGQGLGHTGIVERVVGGKLVTIEGNTNNGGLRNGIGVYRRSMRTMADISKGFIDYSTL